MGNSVNIFFAALLISAFVLFFENICTAQHLPELFPHQADRGIAGILLHDRISSETVFGKEIKWQQADQLQAQREMGQWLCFNAGRSELLLAYHYAKRVINTVQVLRVMPAEDAEKQGLLTSEPQCVLADVANFESERGVKLGLSVPEITRRFGQLYKAGHRDGETILKFRIERDTSHLLKHYAEIGYFGNYYFRNGKLVEFEFGFQPKSGPLF